MHGLHAVNWYTLVNPSQTKSRCSGHAGSPATSSRDIHSYHYSIQSFVTYAFVVLHLHDYVAIPYKMNFGTRLSYTNYL